MSGEPKTDDGILIKRVPVIVRSWDGPNSRIGLEMDLSQMPWGPFDALGKRLSLLLPVDENEDSAGPGSESEVERALRHVEHAADRCGDFAKLPNGDQDLWRRSQETWEWIRRYLTSLWVQVEVEGRPPEAGGHEPPPGPVAGPPESAVPTLPGAASTLKVAARALRATPLSVWRETMGSLDPESPTREEAVQTLLGVARILSGQTSEGPALDAETSTHPQPVTSEGTGSPDPEPDPVPQGEPDPDQVSFDFAKGYDEGYQMGRRVGLALGAKRKNK